MAVLTQYLSGEVAGVLVNGDEYVKEKTTIVSLNLVNIIVRHSLIINTLFLTVTAVTQRHL